jgi:hypothetical protein
MTLREQKDTEAWKVYRRKHTKARADTEPLTSIPAHAQVFHHFYRT